MARKPRIHFSGAFYHVIVRGNGGQDIFRRDDDYQFYLALLEEYKKRFHFRIYAYALMTNHAHLLLEVAEVPLARIMQIVQFRYARKFNFRYGREGHLFQGRYRAILCDKERYFLVLSAYIHLNPVRGGLVHNPSHYPWSSYRYYVGSERSGVVDRKLILSLFGGRGQQAQRAYERFVNARMQDGKAEDFYDVKDQCFLGDEEFIQEVRLSLSEAKQARGNVSIERLILAVSNVIGIERVLFYSATRGREGAWGRAVVAYLGRKMCGYENSEIAKHFGRDPATLSCGIRRVEERMAKEESFAKQIKRLEEMLERGIV